MAPAAPALSKGLKPATAPKQLAVLWAEQYVVGARGTQTLLFLRLADAHSFRLIASELASLSIHADCSPVVDLPVPGAHDVIGDRALGSDPMQVAALGRAVLDSGDELVPVGKPVAAHQIPASNGVMLSWMLAPYIGVTHAFLGPVADDPAALAVALKRAEDCHILITSGGASVGGCA